MFTGKKGKTTIREELYRIARELLLNALRHAEMQRKETEIHYGEEMLRLRIRDDGIGIDLKVLQEGRDGHWGLRGARERAERIGTQLDYWSEAGAGTEVELAVPANIAYAESPVSLRSRLFRKVGHYEQRN